MHSKQIYKHTFDLKMRDFKFYYKQNCDGKAAIQKI